MKTFVERVLDEVNEAINDWLSPTTGQGKGTIIKVFHNKTDRDECSDCGNKQ